MIPGSTQKNVTRVGELAGDHVSRHRGAALRVVCPPVLLAAQEHIARDRPLDTGQKPAVLGQKRYGHPVLAAVAEEERATQDVPEADDPAERVNGNMGLVHPINPYLHRLPLCREV